MSISRIAGIALAACTAVVASLLALNAEAHYFGYVMIALCAVAAVVIETYVARDRGRNNPHLQDGRW